MILELSKNYLYSLKYRDDRTNFYQQFIKDNKTLSENMIFSLKYLSNKIPKNFNITKMDLERNIEKQSQINKSGLDQKEFDEENHLIISISGFLNKGLKQAENDLKIFRENIKNDDLFKFVETIPEGDENKWKSYFKINLFL